MGKVVLAIVTPKGGRVALQERKVVAPRVCGVGDQAELRAVETAGGVRGR